MSFGSGFLFNIFNIFTIYKIFVRENYEHITEAIIQSSWNGYFSFYCFITIVVSSAVTRSGKFSAVLCHRAINYSDDDSIINCVCIFCRYKLSNCWVFFLQFKIFSQQMRHRSPIVTCGLFLFDFSLLFTVSLQICCRIPDQNPLFR